MKNKKILNLYSPKKIDEAIKICDNLFYSDYLQSGELKTREEIQQHIKTEVTQSFVQFWGDDYADELTEKIANTKIHFVYQIDGTSNTISRYLIDLKTKRFNDRYDTQYEAPSLFKSANKLLSGWFYDPVRRLQKLMRSDRVEYSLVYCINELKLDKDKILKDDVYARTVVEQIKALGKQAQMMKYSDNPEVHKKVLTLEKLVKKVKINIAKECKRRNLDLREALFVEDLGLEMDPLVQRMQYDENAEVLLTQQDFLALQDDGYGVYFGIQPDDATLLHEFVHQVDFQGFEKNHKNMVKLTYSDEMRQNEVFNEVITDYFSILMKKQREAEKKPCIVANFESESLYSLLFERMGKFLEAYLPELKVTRLREYPAEEFARIIGRKNFDMFAVLCNELVTVKHDLDVCRPLKENEQNFNDLMADNGVFLYGSIDYFIQNMESLESAANFALEKTMRKALAKQPLLKKIDLFLASQSQQIAQRLEQNQHHKLSQLAPVFAKSALKFKDKAQKVAIKKLKKPLTSADVKHLLTQDQTCENTAVATEDTVDCLQK